MSPTPFPKIHLYWQPDLSLKEKDHLASWVTNCTGSGSAITARNKSLAKMATLKLQIIARYIWLYRQQAQGQSKPQSVFVVFTEQRSGISTVGDIPGGSGSHLKSKIKKSRFGFLLQKFKCYFFHRRLQLNLSSDTKYISSRIEYVWRAICWLSKVLQF